MTRIRATVCAALFTAVTSQAQSVRVLWPLEGDRFVNIGCVAKSGSEVTVAGESSSLGNDYRLFVWRGGEPEIIPLPDGVPRVTPMDISDDGHVLVGYAPVLYTWDAEAGRLVPSTPSVAMVRIGNDEPIWLTPPEHFTEIRIKLVSGNEEFAIVEAVGAPPYQRGRFRWSVDGGFEEIAPPEGMSMPEITAVNYDGSIVMGYRGYDSGFSNPFLKWTTTTGWSQLPGDWNEFAHSAFAMNDDGTIVLGNREAVPGGRMVGWRWHNGTRQDISAVNDFNVRLLAADRPGTKAIGHRYLDTTSEPIIWTTSGGVQKLLDALSPSVDLDGLQIYRGSMHRMSADGSIVTGEGVRAGWSVGWVMALSGELPEGPEPRDPIDPNPTPTPEATPQPVPTITVKIPKVTTKKQLRIHGRAESASSVDVRFNRERARSITVSNNAFAIKLRMSAAKNTLRIRAVGAGGTGRWQTYKIQFKK